MLREWIAFCAAGLIWGTSFLWIKVALEEIGPFTLVAFRLLFGAMSLLAVMWIARKRVPRDLKTLKALAVMALLNPGVPFLLISWSETRIDSSVASILNAMVPLFTILIAHAMLPDEKITRSRLLGLILGFFGVVALMSRDLRLSGLHGAWGYLAMLGATVLYGFASVHSRKRLRGFSPIVQSAVVTLISDVFIWLALPITEWPLKVPVLAWTWVALLWMGLLGTCVAFLCYFYLLNSWGATRASVVNFVFPLVGVVLGVVFRHERVDWHLMVGSLLILCGVVVVNFRALLQLRYKV